MFSNRPPSPSPKKTYTQLLSGYSQRELQHCHKQRPASNHWTLCVYITLIYWMKPYEAWGSAFSFLSKCFPPEGSAVDKTQDYVNCRGLEQIQAPQMRLVSSELRLTMVFWHKLAQCLFLLWNYVFLCETFCQQTHGHLTYLFLFLDVFCVLFFPCVCVGGGGYRVSPAQPCWSQWLPRLWRSTKERNMCTSSCWTSRSLKG